MFYLTEEQKQKVNEHIDSIVAYIESEIQPHLVDETSVTVEFRNCDDTLNCSLTVSDSSVTGRIGYAGVHFDKGGKMHGMEDVYESPEWRGIEFVRNWKDIKRILNYKLRKQMEEYAKLADDIENFAV